MKRENDNRELVGETGASCDIRVWSAACERSEYKTEGDQYLCATCGNIVGLNHEVHHEMFPHICGDDDNLS